MKTSVPRMFSSIWNETSVSGNRCSRAWPMLHAQKLGDLLRERGMRAAGKQFELAATHSPGPARDPAVIRPHPDATEVARAGPLSRSGDADERCDAEVVGAGGFEPSNTGSKVPRLTAWPRPISGSTARACAASGRGSPTRRDVESGARPRRRGPQACPQKVKCSRSYGRLGNGPAHAARTPARVSVRVRIAAGAALRRAASTQRGRGGPAAEQAENRRAAARHRRRDRARLPQRDPSRPVISGCRRTHRRLEIVDHLRRARRPGHRQLLQLARFLQARRPVLVVPRVGLARSTRRTAAGR